ncbi:helix-turn-helix domain-containing protein [Streptomyces sp. OV198]|uniref:MarR family transcriptional regulator n=1 Tax=Streptomyces sp. OV198 TaxID=1882787 RepID=UPI000BE3B8CF|nr:helix-turn-helix domain-containing protein [Streptomyces sp. OV198]
MVNEQTGRWSFLTGYARVLIVVARDPAIRLRDIAAACHITERTAQYTVTGLEQAGYLRRTAHALHPLPGRHPPPSNRGAPVRPGTAGTLHLTRQQALKLRPRRRRMLCVLSDRRTCGLRAGRARR